MILRLNVREYRRGNQQKDNPENTEGAIQKGPSRETGYTRRRNTKQKHNPISVRHHKQTQIT
jgi:hypothetical protein